MSDDKKSNIDTVDERIRRETILSVTIYVSPGEIAYTFRDGPRRRFKPEVKVVISEELKPRLRELAQILAPYAGVEKLDGEIVMELPTAPDTPEEPGS